MKQKKAGNKNSLPVHDPRELETILEVLREGVCRIGPDRSLIYANRSASRILGRSLDEIIGQQYPGVFFNAESPDDARCAPIEFALAEGEVAHINTESVTRPDGTDYLAEMVCVPVEAGESKGVVVSILDVTDRRDVERAVSDARDDALEAARSKAEFLAHMSHEIRTPLTGIIGTAELLSGTGLVDDQREYVTALANSTQFLFSIVNDILDFSKLEAGKFVPRNDAFSLVDLSNIAVDPYRSETQRKGLNLTVEIEKDLPEIVVGDSRCIRQVLNNLLSNAVKFTETGGIEVCISKGNDEGLVRFSVSDTGIGVDPGKDEELFSPFEQAESDIDRAFEGTGLGLSISRRLVKLLQGRIGFDSREVGGSRFWFEVPLERGTEVPLGKESSVPKELKFHGSKPSILVVEDNPINAMVIERMLAGLGLETKVAINGTSAVESCRENKYDLIFMDCQMPGVDGCEATRRILAIRSDSPTIIAFTANVSDDDHEKYKAAGMTGFLPKPFTENQLIDVICKHAEGAKGPKFLDLDKEFIEHSLSRFVEVETLNRLLSLESEDPRGFLSEILEVFVQHASARLADLKDCISRKDRKGIMRLAHNLKGSSANVGILGLTSLFAELERKAPDEDFIGLEELHQELVAKFETVSTAISRMKLKEDPNDGKRGTSD